MNRLFLLTGLFAISVFLSQPLIAQKNEGRPKVGVVLSGGGAKGFAHVGVLKVLEEAGVQIDYISGTSMGAIVGGLYASGWTADQLDSILQNTNFREIMEDDFSREVLPFFEKEYGEKYALSLSVKDFKIKLPSAISNGQNALNTFSRLTMHVTDIDDFRKLPIPFLCIGTDVETGQEVVFEKGNLARAIRASGSFPGLLTPFEVDGKIIADGGIVNNFPARILKEKGMDFIIGVSVEDGLYSKENLFSIDKIIEQVGSFQMVQNSKSQLKYCDILIHPNHKGYGLTSFEAADTLVRAGEAEAEKYRIELTELAMRQGRGENARTFRKRLPNQDSVCIDEVSIINIGRLEDAGALDFFPEGLEGTISEESFYNGIINLYGTGMFRYVDYSFLKKGDGAYNLNIKGVEKEGFERRLRVGVHFDNVYKSNLLLNLTLLNAGIENSTFSGNLILGDRFRYTANYLIDYGSKPDIGINSSLEINPVPIELPARVEIDSSFQIAKFDFLYTDFSNEIYLRLFSNNKQAIGVASGLKFFSASTDQLVDEEENRFVGERGLYFKSNLYYKFDSRSNRNFPESGSFSDFRFRYIYPLSSKIFDYSNFNASFNIDWSFAKIIPLTGNFSLGLEGDVGVTLGDSTPVYLYFLGGNNHNFINNFKPFEGLAFAEKVGQNLLRGTLYGQIRPFNNQFAKISLNVALLTDEINKLRTTQAIRSIGLGYGYDTPVGPIELTYAYSSEGGQWYFNFGYWF